MPSLPPIRPEDEAVAERMRPQGAFDAPADAHDPVRAGYLLRLGDDALILVEDVQPERTTGMDRLLGAATGVQAHEEHRRLERQ